MVTPMLKKSPLCVMTCSNNLSFRSIEVSKVEIIPRQESLGVAQQQAPGWKAAYLLNPAVAPKRTCSLMKL